MEAAQDFIHAYQNHLGDAADLLPAWTSFIGIAIITFPTLPPTFPLHVHPGNLSYWLTSLHESYKSDIVRISPNEVSVISESSWKDIYGHRPGHSNFPKDLRAFAGVDNIVTANDSDHSRIRRLISHAFSDKALREQQSLIMVHVNNLMNGLKRQMGSNTTANVDIVDWFMWTAFDVIGDLSFGESFSCLLDKKFHPWVAWIMHSLKIVVFQSVTLRFPLLQKLLTVCIPAKAAKSRGVINTYSFETVERRLHTKSTRPDFISYITKHNEDTEKGGLTREEIHRNAVTFTTAGSETTAALLSAIVWYLLQNVDCYEKINQEVHSTFQSAEDINLQRIIDLPYLQAVVDETFRVYPPAIAGQPRVAPKGGDTVSGYWIPEGTGIIINQYAANHSAKNFHEPELFAPARWMGTDERFKHDNRGVVQPFSVGPRNCIGKNLAMAEIRLVLAHLFFNFDIEFAEETDRNWAHQEGWFTWAKTPLVVKLSVRNE